MKAKFHLEVPIPRKGDIDGANLYAFAELPFVPHAGMMLVALKSDDFRKVEEVYWSEADGLEVFFEFDEQARIKQLKKLGWREDP